MKRKSLIVLLLLMVFCWIPARADGVSFRWGNSGVNVQLEDASFGTSGTSKAARVFFVHSSGRGQIELVQTKGICTEFGLTLEALKGLSGKGQEWGKYEITVVHAESGRKAVYQWAEAKDNSTCTLKFDSSGNYYVYVRPYSNEEMKDSHRIIVFSAWKTPAQWEISKREGCTVSVTSAYGTASPTSNTTSYKNSSSNTNTWQPQQSNTPYDIGIPDLNGNVYYENASNVYVLWVQYQLKATGQYYIGDNWDETGNLGDKTMEEIAKFMKANGHSGHNGRVDQTVINTLASRLGSRRVPVYVGGYYEKMNTIMSGGSAGSMKSINSSSSSTKIKWVQTCLKKLGYYTSSIDGKFGSGTTNALHRFQRDYGYEPRDYVSLGVARRMLEVCYSRGYSMDDLP